MSILRKLLCSTAAVCGLAGATLAQTAPTPRAVPFCETFGAAGSTTAPSGFAAWNGLDGGNINTQALAAAATQTGNATIATTQPSTTGGSFYYVPTATPGNARLAVVTSSNATNGVNVWVLAINTTGQTALTLSYDLINVAANPRTVGVVAQYRAGTSGSWTTLPTVTGNPYVQTGGTANTVTPVTLTLPAGALGQANVQIRWAVWRGSETGNSSAFGIDNVCVQQATVQNGTCCQPSGACTDTTSNLCTTGTFTANTTCAATPCVATQGACCTAAGVCSLADTAAACASGSYFQGVGTTCGSNPCPTGACCQASGVCVNGQIQAACELTNGTANGNFWAGGQACTASPCPFGACCTNTGQCSLRLVAGCTGTQSFQGPGTSCQTAGICPNFSGACCSTATGTCSIVVGASACTNGTYGGDGSTCTGAGAVTCAQPVGACCSGGTCVVTAANACGTNQNDFLGGGTTCTAGICVPPSTVVISQIYGGGGNANATLTHDFVELRNRSSSAVSLDGWSIQYSSSTGSSWANQLVALTGSIPANGYYLVRLGSGLSGNPASNLPTPEAVDNFNISASAGKFALVRTVFSLSGNCPTGAAIVDFVGFGSGTDCSETANATGPSNNTDAMFRAQGGCQDTNNNNSDFARAVAMPRNSATAGAACVGSTPPTVASTSVTPNPSCPGTQVTISVTVNPGTGTVSGVTANLTNIGGGAAVALTNGGGNVWSTTATVAANTTTGSKNIPITITASDTTGSGSTTVNVTTCNPAITTGTGATPSAVCNGTASVFTVNVIPGQNPASMTITVTADLTQVGGANGVAFTPGANNSFTLSVTPAAGTAAGSYNLPITVTDNLNRTDTGTITLVTAPCVNDPNSDVVISQIYGGGGNSGAVYTNDYVELFNRSGGPVNVTGWSLQYASSADTGNTGPFGSGNFGNNPVALTGTIPAGGYYLVALSNSGGTPQGVALPAADATGTINMNANDARVVLVRNSTAPLQLPGGGSDCGSTLIADLVGYGSATCYEGGTTVGAAQSIPDNATALFRQLGGCQDTTNNRVDFFRGAPAPRNAATAVNPCGVVTPTGACCLAGNQCAIRAGSSACIGGNYQGDGTVCTPTNPCAPASVRCCRGSTCAITAAVDCVIPAGPRAGAVTAGVGTACNAPGNTDSPCCLADYNKQNNVDLLDIFAFLEDWFSGVPFTNHNGDSNASGDLLDIFSFLGDWFAGECPTNP